ncbi:uncharacterized protein G2W53_019318 [Senna tora]|uniref:Uncharacterized protein n=1 Tax=Senna tora TaxID=362788 RepID=A0A834WRX8_9FABA|nr:uncharacterized protein G2W53_019318 [Senna tora]
MDSTMIADPSAPHSQMSNQYYEHKGEGKQHRSHLKLHI